VAYLREEARLDDPPIHRGPAERGARCVRLR
jgi:hypothetical protein